MAAAVVVSALLSACSHVQPKLHVTEIEQAIVSQTRVEFKGARLGTARCPSGRVQRKGDTFTCTLTVDGQVAHFRVRQTDSHGRVGRLVLVEPFVLVRDLNTAVAQDVRNTDLLEVKAKCGTGVVIILHGPRTVRCTATYEAGVVRRADVVLSATAQVGAVHFVDALVSTFKIGSEIALALSAARGHVVYVQCGDREAVVPVGGKLHCQGADGLGAPLYPVEVTVNDTAGHYTYTPTK